MQLTLRLRLGCMRDITGARSVSQSVRRRTRMNRSTSIQGSLWQDYRRRRLRFLVVWLTYVPGVLIVGYPLTRAFGSDIPIYLVAGAWMLAFVFSAGHMESFSCPRCHRAFFCASWFHNPLARRCVHCGFPKWSDFSSEHDHTA